MKRRSFVLSLSYVCLPISTFLHLKSHFKTEKKYFKRPQMIESNVLAWRSFDCLDNGYGTFNRALVLKNIPSGFNSLQSHTDWIKSLVDPLFLESFWCVSQNSNLLHLFTKRISVMAWRSFDCLDSGSGTFNRALVLTKNDVH